MINKTLAILLKLDIIITSVDNRRELAITLYNNTRRSYGVLEMRE